VTEVRSELGARFDTLYPVGESASLLLRARAAWAYDWVNDPALMATFEAGLQPGALPGAGVGFAVNGAPVPNNLALASAGAELRFANHWSLLAKIDGEIAKSAQVYTGSGTLRYSW
jgi:outer membrane autotransporter protein